MLLDLFKEIKVQNGYYATAIDGDAFEQRFKNKLKVYGFSEIVAREGKTTNLIGEISALTNMKKADVKIKLSSLKEKVLNKNSIELISNPFPTLDNTFIFQPHGSQNFPDFLVFFKGKAIPIEIKYSKNDRDNKGNLSKFKPMWNSNMPKHNAVYIFGVSGEAVTFFIGADILDFETRQMLLDYFDQLDKNEINLDKKLVGQTNNFGIYPYVRKAYEHKQKYSTYVNPNGTKGIESYFSENKNIREKNVLDFLETISKKY